MDNPIFSVTRCFLGAENVAHKLWGLKMVGRVLCLFLLEVGALVGFHTAQTAVLGLCLPNEMAAAFGTNMANLMALWSHAEASPVGSTDCGFGGSGCFCIHLPMPTSRTFAIGASKTSLRTTLSAIDARLAGAEQLPAGRAEVSFFRASSQAWFRWALKRFP